MNLKDFLESFYTMRVSLLTGIPNTTQLITGIVKARLYWRNINVSLKYMRLTWAMGQT